MIRKKFIDIEIPLLEETVSVLGPSEKLIGKTIRLDLTRKLKGKSLEIIFKIFSQENNLIALPKKMNLMKFYIKRMMRKNISYVEDSIKAQCKDCEIIIKPFLITRKKVSRAVRNHLRTTTKKFLLDYVKEKDYLDICEKILRGTLQKTMLPKLKKIYPLSFCEIRVFETKEIEKIIKNNKTQEIKSQNPVI